MLLCSLPAALAVQREMQRRAPGIRPVYRASPKRNGYRFGTCSIFLELAVELEVEPSARSINPVLVFHNTTSVSVRTEQLNRNRPTQRYRHYNHHTIYTMATPLSKMVQPHRPMVRFTAIAARGNPAPCPASSARSIEPPEIPGAPVSASPSAPNLIGRYGPYQAGDDHMVGCAPAPISRSTSDSFLGAGIRTASSGGRGGVSRGLSNPGLRRTLR